MNHAKKIPLIFRVTRSNRFTIPVLLNALEKRRWNVTFDIRLADSFQALARTVSPEGGIVAYSFMTPDSPEVVGEIQRLRRKRGNGMILLAGGPHATGDPDGTLRMGFDAVVCGDGENGLPLFCEEIMRGDLVQGMVLNSPPLLDLDESFPVSETDPLVPPLEIARGCRYGCAFCQTRARKPLYRSGESVDKFFDALIGRGYVFRTGFICPSGFEYGHRSGQPDPERLERMLASAKSRGIRYLEYGIFPSEVRPNTVSHSFLDLVKKYCSNKKITIGAQSGSNRILKKEARGHSAHETERAAALIREHGFQPQIDFILGFPDENEDDQILTLEQMRRLALGTGAWNQVHYFLPLSGTPEYRRKSAPLSKKSVRMLDAWTQNGYASDWWKKGLETAGKFEKFREKLSDQR